MTNSIKQNGHDYLLLPSAKFKNAERPFTELLALLKSYQSTRKNKKIEHDIEALEASYKHVTNALSSLIWGMESVGYVLGLAASGDDMHPDYASGTGYFIKSIANLVEALSDFRRDIEEKMRIRK
jgi:hypothetical protein